MKFVIAGLFVVFAILFVLIGLGCCQSASDADDKEEEYWKKNAEHCVICGKVIPEGRMVCLQCELGQK